MCSRFGSLITKKCIDIQKCRKSEPRLQLRPLTTRPRGLSVALNVPIIISLSFYDVLKYILERLATGTFSR